MKVWLKLNHFTRGAARWSVSGSRERLLRAFCCEHVQLDSRRKGLVFSVIFHRAEVSMSKPRRS